MRPRYLESWAERYDFDSGLRVLTEREKKLQGLMSLGPGVIRFSDDGIGFRVLVTIGKHTHMQH